jgi:hypothetical protein
MYFPFNTIFGKKIGGMKTLIFFLTKKEGVWISFFFLFFFLVRGVEKFLIYTTCFLRVKTTHLLFKEDLIFIGGMSGMWVLVFFLERDIQEKLEFFLWSLTCGIGTALGSMDLHFKRVPLAGVLLLGVIGTFSVFMALGMEKEGGARLVSFLVGGCIVVSLKGSPEKRGWGEGDQVLLVILSSFLTFPLLPCFLILVGAFGVLSFCYTMVFYKTPSFPFIPSLMGGFILVRLLKNNLLTFLF